MSVTATHPSFGALSPYQPAGSHGSALSKARFGASSADSWTPSTRRNEAAHGPQFSGLFSSKQDKVKAEAKRLFNQYHNDPDGLFEAIQASHPVDIHYGGWASEVLSDFGARGAFFSPYSREYPRLDINKRLQGYPDSFPQEIALRMENSGRFALLFPEITHKSTVYEEIFHLLQAAHGLQVCSHPDYDEPIKQFVNVIDGGIESYRRSDTDYAYNDPAILKEKAITDWLTEQAREVSGNRALKDGIKQTLEREREVCEFMNENSHLLPAADVEYYRYYQAFYAALLKALR